MNFIIKILSIAFIFLLSFQLHAQTDVINSIEECQEHINKGYSEIQKNQYAKAVEHLTKAGYFADKNKLTDLRITIMNNLGLCYDNLSNYGEALGQYKKALDLAKDNPKKVNTKLIILSNIAIIYCYEKDYKTALAYLLEAYPIAKALHSDLNRNLLAINISDVYNKLGNYKKARFYLLEVEKLPREPRHESFWKLNYAETLILEGHIKEAQYMLEKLIQDPKLDNNIYVYAVEFLSVIYSNSDNIIQAIKIAEKGLEHSPVMSERLKLYNQLSELYFKNREYARSKQYKDSVIIAKDSLSRLINRGLFESNKIRFKLQEYQNQLEVNKERQAAERKLFIGSIVFCLLLLVALYRGLKNKITKQKQEKIIAENKNKIFYLEMESLKNNIAEKNRTLSAKALYLSGRNELIEEVINSLAHVPEVTRSAEVSEYISTLRSYLKTDDQWDQFIRYFEQVNPEFLKKLHTRHPQLTAPDVRFLCYVYMNLDVREIGSIFNITYNAAVKRLYRIKEKMELNKDASLYEYLLQLV